MKKLIGILAVMALAATSSFALDLGDVQGTWKDSKWDANWTFATDGKINLTKASTGESVFTFNDSNVKNFKLDAGISGVTISFDCEETERSYKFTKPLTLNADLEMHIDPNWTSTSYDTTIKFQR